LDLTVDQLAEVAVIVDAEDEWEAEYRKTLLKLIAGRPTL
jgi:hypothetical protein